MKILFFAAALASFVSGYAAFAEEKAKESNSAEQVLKTVVSIKTQVNRNGQRSAYWP